jgi:CheY-like chemotaxis protein
MDDVPTARAVALLADLHVQDYCILLVEDETVIAFLIEDMLTDLGFRQVIHVASVPDAMALLRTKRPDAAILDVNVRNAPVYPVAESLAAARVPFMFATGYGPGAIPAPWRYVTVIQKPFEPATLAVALGSILAHCQSRK